MTIYICKTEHSSLLVHLIFAILNLESVIFFHNFKFEIFILIHFCKKGTIIGFVSSDKIIEKCLYNMNFICVINFDISL